MARPLRIEFSGAIYHVTSRMIGSWEQSRDRLFRDDRDFNRFLELLAQRVNDFGVRLYLFCLMTNHYHLVLETPKPNLSRFMQNLSTAYTVYYNLRHRRHGHLLDGRYKAKLVSGDDYLLRLSRYVHQNPVWVEGWAKRPIGERIKRLQGYPWSSYAGYIGCRVPFGFVDEAPILAMMSGRPSGRRRLYREYVDSGLARADEEFREAMKASPCGIGDEEFQQTVGRWRMRTLGKRQKKEDVSFRRVAEGLGAATVLAEVAKVFAVEEAALRQPRRHLTARAVAAKYLIKCAGFTQREAADRLGIGTGAAVCILLKRLATAASSDSSLDKKLRGLEEEWEAQLAARKPRQG